MTLELTPPNIRKQMILEPTCPSMEKTSSHRGIVLMDPYGFSYSFWSPTLHNSRQHLLNQAQQGLDLQQQHHARQHQTILLPQRLQARHPPGALCSDQVTCYSTVAVRLDWLSSTCVAIDVGFYR